MATKGKSTKKKPSVLHFILLILLVIGGAQGMKHYPELKGVTESVKTIAEQTASNLPSKNTVAATTDYYKGLEIPRALKNKNEILLHRNSLQGFIQYFLQNPKTG